MAADLKGNGVIVVLMHSGIVKTGLDASGASFKVQEAVETVEVAEKLGSVLMKKGIDDTGRFWHREG